MVKFLPCLFVGGCVAGATTGVVYSTVVQSDSYVEESSKEAQFKTSVAVTAGCVPVTQGLKKEQKLGEIYMCAARKDSSDRGLIPLYYLEEESLEKLDSSTEDPMSLLKKIHKFKKEKETGVSSSYYLSFDLGDGNYKKIPLYNPDAYSWNLFSGFAGTQ